MIHIEGTARGVMAEPGTTLLSCLLRAKVPIDHSCEGMGSCGTCRVIVVSEYEGLEDRTDLELEMATERGFEDNERLACQSLLQGSVRIKIPNK